MSLNDATERIQMKAMFNLAVVGVALVCGLVGCTRQKEVPMLEGMDLKDAQAHLVQFGFQVGRIDNEFTGQKDSGKVLRQVPAASTKADKGATINLTVEESVTMPDLGGMDAEAATRMLASLGLRLQKVEKKVVGGATPGAIVSQTPAPGERIAARSAANLVVDDFVVVPDFTGDSYDDVRKQLPQSGLTLGRKYYKQSTVKAGTILEQIPEAGSKVARDTALQFELAQAVATAGTRPAADTGRGNNPFEEPAANAPGTKPKKDIGNAVGDAVGSAISNALNGLFDAKGKAKDKTPPPQQSEGTDTAAPTNKLPAKATGPKALWGLLDRHLK